MKEERLERDIAEFGQAIGSLLRRLRSANESADLSWTQYAVINRLDRNGPTTTAELARAEGIKPQSMGAIVGALEELGIVERKPHPTDGRQVNIQLTTQGIALRQSVKDARWKWLAEAVAELDEGERETLLAAGHIIKRLAEK